MLIKLALYFVVGGVVVSAVTYFGSAGRGLLSAFVATLPHISLLTFILIYLNSGEAPTLAYARGLLIFAPAWLAYVTAFMLLLPRAGFWPALGGSVTLFFTAIALTRLLIR